MEAECAAKEAASNLKDDMIRELKQKLEAAPENITVPMPGKEVLFVFYSVPDSLIF